MDKTFEARRNLMLLIDSFDRDASGKELVLSPLACWKIADMLRETLKTVEELEDNKGK